MPVDRNFWTSRFYRNTFSQIRCPNCHDGVLVLDEKTLAEGETADSLGGSQHPDHEPEWTEGRFSCLLRCEKCAETVAVAGEYTLESSYEEDGRYATTIYTPHFFQTAPNLFLIPEQVPEEVTAEVKKAFGLYWLDASASANRIRTGIEMLLTHLEIPRYTITRQRKRASLSLSSRIDKLKKRRPGLSDEFVGALTAIRHLGNAGSHPTGLTQDDLLDAMVILDHVFQEIFVQPGKRVAKITKQINRRKAPRSK